MPVKIKESDTMPLNGRHFTRNGSRPTWEIAQLFPVQGEWTEKDYFDRGGRSDDFPIRELADGWLEILPMPTELHQMILIYFFDLLRAFTTAHAPGTVLLSGTRM